MSHGRPGAADHHGSPGQREVLMWCGVVAAIGTTCLLTDRVATATSSTSGALGRVLSHLDVGKALVLVAVTVAVAWIWSGAGPLVSARTWWLRAAVAVYAAWLLAVISAIAALHPTV